MPVTLRQMLDGLQARRVCRDMTPLSVKTVTNMQAFIHASAGEFNGLRLAWIGRNVPLSHQAI